MEMQRGAPPPYPTNPLYLETTHRHFHNHHHHPALLKVAKPSSSLPSTTDIQIPPGVTSPHKQLRSGKWTKEEEVYALLLIEKFRNGMLSKSEVLSSSLRAWLAKKLNCCPMRISKKFAGDLSLGKTPYKSLYNFCELNSEEILKSAERLEEAHAAFINSLNSKEDKKRYSKKHRKKKRTTDLRLKNAAKRKSPHHPGTRQKPSSLREKRLKRENQGTPTLAIQTTLDCINTDFNKVLKECVGVTNDKVPIASADGSLIFSGMPLIDNSTTSQDDFDLNLNVTDVPSLEEITGSPTAVYEIFQI